MNMKTMMKMTGLALAFGSMVAFADEPATGDAVSSPRQTKTAATTAPVDAVSSPRQTKTAATTIGRGGDAASTRAARPQLTEAQRAEMKARREKFMAERRAAMEAKMLEIVKKYVPEEEKAKALVKELEEAMKAGIRAPRNLGHKLPPPKRPAAKPAAKPAEAPAPAAPAK